MHPEQNKIIIDTLNVMRYLELEVAHFYEICSQTCGSEEKLFWRSLVKSEKKHAAYIEKMIGIISQRPNDFVRGVPFNTVAVNTVLASLKNNIERLQQGGIDKNRVLFVARDYENAMMESRYGEVVKTKDVEYLMLMDEIVRNTTEHRNMLNRKISEANQNKSK